MTKKNVTISIIVIAVFLAAFILYKEIRSRRDYQEALIDTSKEFQYCRVDLTKNNKQLFSHVYQNNILRWNDSLLYAKITRKDKKENTAKITSINVNTLEEKILFEKNYIDEHEGDFLEFNIIDNTLFFSFSSSIPDDNMYWIDLQNNSSVQPLVGIEKVSELSPLMIERNGKFTFVVSYDGGTGGGTKTYMLLDVETKTLQTVAEFNYGAHGSDGGQDLIGIMGDTMYIGEKIGDDYQNEQIYKSVSILELHTFAKRKLISSDQMPDNVKKVHLHENKLYLISENNQTAIYSFDLNTETLALYKELKNTKGTNSVMKDNNLCLYYEENKQIEIDMKNRKMKDVTVKEKSVAKCGGKEIYSREENIFKVSEDLRKDLKLPEGYEFSCSQTK